MDSEDIVGMVMGIFFFVTTGAVLILRPIAKRLGSYLEVLAEERRNRRVPQAAVAPDAARLAAVLESIEHRLAKIEEQQEFTERLLAERNAPQIQNR
jgi:tetrahydromethanopterin S-methyltransferase subunit G